jgi:hypothetical protein
VTAAVFLASVVARPFEVGVVSGMALLVRIDSCADRQLRGSMAAVRVQGCSGPVPDLPSVERVWVKLLLLE